MGNAGGIVSRCRRYQFAITGGIKRGKYSNEDAEVLLAWVSSALDSHPFEVLNLNHFGGEPTLNLPAVFRLARGAKEMCDRRGVALSQQMVTNGYSLSAEDISEMANLGIRSAQITLDGLSEVHNARRSRGFDSFGQIVQNIKCMAHEGIDIFVLHVFDTSNVGSALELVDFFDGLARRDEVLRERVSFNFVPTIPKDTELVSCNKYVQGNEVLLSGLAVEAFERAVSKGFGIANFLEIGHCFRQARHSVLVSPTLDLYKCYGVFGNERYSVANLKDVSYDKYLRLAEQYQRADGLSDDCSRCNVAPLCRGGCQFTASEQNGGEYGHQYCEKATIERSLRGFVERGLSNC